MNDFSTAIAKALALIAGNDACLREIVVLSRSGPPGIVLIALSMAVSAIAFSLSGAMNES